MAERRVKRGRILCASPCGPRRCPRRAAPRSAAADTHGAPLTVRTARIAPRGARKQRAQGGIATIYSVFSASGRTWATVATSQLAESIGASQLAESISLDPVSVAGLVQTCTSGDRGRLPPASVDGPRSGGNLGELSPCILTPAPSINLPA